MSAGAVFPWFRLSILGNISLGEQAADRRSANGSFLKVWVILFNGVPENSEAASGKTCSLWVFSEQFWMNSSGYLEELKSEE